MKTLGAFVLFAFIAFTAAGCASGPECIPLHMGCEALYIRASEPGSHGHALCPRCARSVPPECDTCTLCGLRLAPCFPAFHEMCSR
jgi:hypothetical protein